MVDFARFEELQRIQDEGKIFSVLDAAGKLTDLKVKIAGPDSQAQRKAQSVIESKMLNGRRGGLEISDESFREWGIERIAAAVLDWENLDFNGEPLECTHENVIRMMTSFPVFHSQIAFFASERSLYMPEDHNKTSEAEGSD